MHLILDGYAQDKEFLTNADRISQWLLKVVKEIGMQAMGQPYLVNFGLGAGITGVLIIKESHICIHTWPEFSGLQVDCCSCRSFNAAIFTGSICKEAMIDRPATLILQRGVKGNELIRPKLALGVAMIEAERERPKGGLILR